MGVIYRPLGPHCEGGVHWTRGLRQTPSCVGSIAAFACSAGRTVWPSDKAKVPTYQEEDEVNDGAHPAELWHQDKVGAQERHRNTAEIEIELNASAYKERARQEFAKLPAPPSEIDCCRCVDDAYTYVEDRNHGRSPSSLGILELGRPPTAVRALASSR